ncbi:MAG: hypothetical protein QM767_26460 [Anaeromyxobacter sp.]
MRRSLSSALRLAALGLVLACASAGVPYKTADLPPQAPPAQEENQALGEVVLTMNGNARGLAWGRWRVYGAAADLTYVGENTWGGELLGRPVRLTVANGKITGAGVNLTLEQSGSDVTLGGTVFQRTVRITYAPDAIRGKTASAGPGFELRRESPDRWAGNWGPGNMLFVNMKGAAGSYPQSLEAPQFHLIMLGLLL